MHRRLGLKRGSECRPTLDRLPQRKGGGDLPVIGLLGAVAEFSAQRREREIPSAFSIETLIGAICAQDLPSRGTKGLVQKGPYSLRVCRWWLASVS